MSIGVDANDAKTIELEKYRRIFTENYSEDAQSVVSKTWT